MTIGPMLFSVYLSLLGDLLRKHDKNLSYHIYAYDNLFCTTFACN